MVAAIAVERGIDDDDGEVVGVAPEVVERLSAYVADVTSGQHQAGLLVGDARRLIHDARVLV